MGGASPPLPSLVLATPARSACRGRAPEPQEGGVPLRASVWPGPGPGPGRAHHVVLGWVGGRGSERQGLAGARKMPPFALAGPNRRGISEASWKQDFCLFFMENWQHTSNGIVYDDNKPEAVVKEYL